MTIFELVAKLSLDSKGYENGIELAKKSASKFGEGIKNIGKIAGVAFGAAEAAVTAFATASINTGQKFDSAMSQVAATMGTTVDEIQNLRDFAQEMGRTTAFSASEAADAMNILAMAGLNAEQNVATLPAVLNMAAAGGLGIAQAADYATGIIAGFGLETEQAGEIADKLAIIASSAKGDVASFGEGLSTVAGMARTTGQNLDDMTVALGVLGNNNFSASEAGNALSRTLKNLYQPTDSAAKMMTQLGVSAYDANGSARPLMDVLSDLNGALDGMSEQAKNQYLSQIFDAATLKSVPALMNSVNGDWQTLSEKVANSAGAAEKMAGVQLDNLAGDITLFKSALEGAQIALSDQLTPSLRQFVQFGSDGLSRMTDAFSKNGLSGLMNEFASILTDGTKMVIQMLPSFMSAGGQLMIALGKGLMNSVPIITDAVGRMMLKFVGEIVTNLPSITESAISMMQSLTEGFVSEFPSLSQFALRIVSNLASTIRSNVGSLADAGVSMISNIAKGFSDRMPYMMELIPTILENVIGIFTDNIPKLLEMGANLISSLASGVAEAIPTLLETVLPMLLSFTGTMKENIGTLVDAGIELLLGLVQGLMDGLPTLIAYVPQIITNIAGVINENMPKILAAGVKILWMLINGIVQAIPALLSNMGNIMVMVINLVQAINWLSLGKSIITVITNGVKSLATSLPTSLKNIAVKAWEMVKNHDWLGLGKAIIDGIVMGIKNFGSSVVNSLKEIAVGAFKNVKNFFKIGSPSKLMRDEIGRWIPEGLAVGISANADSLYDTMHDLSEGTVDAYNPEIEPVSAGGRYGVQMDGVIAEIKGLKDAMMGMSLVLDTGATVGGLAPAMDAQLGTFAVYKGRGN